MAVSRRRFVQWAASISTLAVGRMGRAERAAASLGGGRLPADALAGDGLQSVPNAARGAAGKPMRGVFMILTTPFTESGEVDWQDLDREVTFVERCGAHGIVWPQGSSGLASLTRDERLRGMEVLATAIRGKKAALTLGVQGKTTAEMLEFARRAEDLAPDAMIAMPPSTATSVDDYREYFRALAAVTRRPVFVQTSGGARDLAPPVEMIVELAREFPHVAYVKEESAPLVDRMKAELRQRPPIKAIFGASLAQGWLYEMRLGLDGVMTGMAMYADLMARIWDLHERGQAESVRDAFSKFLLMRNLSQQIPGTDLYIMRKRGVFKTTTTRVGGGSAREVSTFSFSQDAIAEIEYRFAALKPYLSGADFTS
jgi:dihydrodipicolinate synthase/N-acetylneuraminate lyase